MSEPGLLTSAEVAKEFRVHRATILRWAKDGKLRSVTLPSGGRRFRRADVEAVLATADAEVA